MTSRPAALERGAERYDVLLALLFGVFLLAPFEERASRAAIAASLGGVLLFALWTSAASRPVLIAAAGSIVAATLVSGIAQTTAGRSPQAVFAVVGVILCTATIATIVTRLAPRISANARTLAGSLSIYLLFGLAFAYVYSFVGAVREAGFFAQPGPHDPVSYLYFSFVTLTTIGYGDLTPGSDAGRMLVVIEGLAGQLYLVTVVGVVVSSRVRRRPGAEAP